MRNPFTDNQVHDVVRKHLSEVLGVGIDEVDSATPLIDLGAESLDIVEFRRYLESELGVTLPRKNVLGQLADELGSTDLVYDADGRISDLTANVLHRSAFGYTADEFEAGIWPHEVAAVMTSAHWAAFTHALLDHLPERCSECAGSQSQVAPAGHVQCADCGAKVEPVKGDVLLAADVRTAVAELTASAAAAT